MKTQNTLENKARFFAQYWGQKIICFPHNKNPIRYDNPNKLLAGKFERNAYLELKPLSQISDEDAINLGYGYASHLKSNLDRNIDQLRNLGFAVPYMDLSVEDLVEYGWIKLKEN